MADDPRMCEAFRQGVDIHTVTAATVAVIIAFLSTLLTREAPFGLGDIVFFAGVWLAGTIFAAVILIVIEIVRDRWL